MITSLLSSFIIGVSGFCLVLGSPVSVGKSKNAQSNITIFTREVWGGRPPRSTVPLNTPVPWVVIHHTYIPPACFDAPTCMGYMRSMQNSHFNQGWADIGYNFCIGSEGNIYEGRGFRTLGAHAVGANTVSIGICLIGDWREEVPPVVQLNAVKALIAAGLQQGVISPNYRLIGHQQVSATECPGGALLNEIRTWNNYYPHNFS